MNNQATTAYDDNWTLVGHLNGKHTTVIIGLKPWANFHLPNRTKQ